ncbi:hypothetical protein K438DRAFT_1783185 [Mycena galopus ATCC 62051]|nr:hypothetical protein K438DRAFT_1783185 [Mycena galopus ATCC 62051]
MAHPAEIPPFPQTAEDSTAPDVLKAYEIIAVGYDRSSLSDACLVDSVAPELNTLLQERFEVLLICTPTVSMSGAFFRTLASREAETMVEVGESAEHLSQQLELVPGGGRGSAEHLSQRFGLVPVAAAVRRSRIA